VLVDESQLEAAILNLALNARDAMPEGGRLRIETSNVYFEQGWAERQHDMPPGSYVVITVSDTGAGMNRDVAARALEPFFTTKEGGKNSGLGLSMAYGFIKQSGGEIEIESEVGCGTSVKLLLPRVDLGLPVGR
jgi:signal transduction histidine kinase